MKNEAAYEMISEALFQRKDWEQMLAKFEAQRNGDDRPVTNNDPWPDSSNYRYKLADMMMEQKKSVYSQIIYSSEHFAVFKALTPANLPHAENLAPYFDHIVKEHTNFEIYLVMDLDAGLQDGGSFMKITWDPENQVPLVKWIENLCMIFPSTCGFADESPWCAEVIHLSKREAHKKFGNLPGLDDLFKMSLSDEASDSLSDSVARERERYNRTGINLSGKGGKRLVIWEFHYEDEEGNKRIRTISPDDPKFDFKDDRAYPFYCERQGKRYTKWMYEHFRREWKTPNLYSSRGLPQVIEEEEFLLTALERMKHNWMTLAQMPIFQSATGQPPGSTNNISMMPGMILPNGIQPVTWGAPPMSFDQQSEHVREIAERRMAVPDSGIGRSNTMNDSRTAREVSLMASIQQMAVNYESTPWKKHIRAVLRQMWERIVQYKPESLNFFIAKSIQSLPPDALNGDYLIDVSWSGDNINKEYLGQKAMALWTESLKTGNPRVINETWKNLVEHAAPGQAQRFDLNPQLAAQDMGERIAQELDTIVSIGFPVRPKEDVDHYQAVLMTMQFIQAQEAKGIQLPPQSMNLLSQYMAAHRQMLAKTNPEQRKQLDQQLTEMDQAMAMKEQQASVVQMPQQGVA